MAIVINDINKLHTVEIKEGKDRVTLKLKPLNYAQRSLVLSSTTKMIQGKLKLDYARSCFLYLKYGIKEIIGVSDAEGNPYKLTFDGDELTDACVEDLLASDITDSLLYVADALNRNRKFTEITDPMTGKPLKNVKIIVDKKKHSKKK